MAKVVDPVCGMEIDRGLAAARSEYNGKPYSFCSRERRQILDENPGEFQQASPAAKGSA